MPDDPRPDWDASYNPLAELTHEQIIQAHAPVDLYAYNVEGEASDSKADPAPVPTEPGDAQDAQPFEGAEQAEPSASTATTGGKKTRSREGCLVCRARRIKCDNGKPDCARCIKYGAECVYPVKKRFDSGSIEASLSRRHRKPSKNLPRADYDAQAEYDPHSLADISYDMDYFPPVASHPQTPAPAQVQGIFDVDELMAFFKQTQMGAFFRQRVDPPDFLKPAFPDPDELRCFHHAVTYSFSICVTREDFNPWVQHVAPLFLFPDGKAPLSAEAVRWAMLRIGAIHLSYLNQRDSNTPEDGSYERNLAQRYRTSCLGLLRRARQVEMEGVSDTFCAALLMFFIGEVLSASTPWHEPFRMMRETVQRRGGFSAILYGADGAETPSSLKQYMVEQMTWLELIGSDLQCQMPVLLLGDLSWFDRLGQLAGSEVESIEATFGVNRAIFRLSITNGIIIGQTERAERYHASSAPASSSPLSPTSSNAELAAALPSPAVVQQWMQDMHAWRQAMHANGNGNANMAVGGPGTMDARTRLGSMAYWHACMMGYYRVIEKRQRGDGEVQLSAVAVLDGVVEAGEKVEFILWPLMVAGCNLLSPVLRARCRDLLKSFQYQCCYELEVGMRVLEEVWARIDAGADEGACDWREVMTELGCGSFFG